MHIIFFRGRHRGSNFAFAQIKLGMSPTHREYKTLNSYLVLFVRAIGRFLMLFRAILSLICITKTIRTPT